MTDPKKEPPHLPPLITCPDCECPISIPADSKPDTILECQACGAEILILTVEPFAWKVILEEK
jgi:uncharacterized paraquat-inducible protein A